MGRLPCLLCVLGTACGSVPGNQPDAATGDASDVVDAASTAVRVAVFDDFDPDYMASPFDDRLTIIAFEPANATYVVGTPQSGLNTSQTIGGSHALAVSPNGNHIAVIENVSGSLTGFDRSGAPSGGAPIVNTNFFSVFLTDTRIYAAMSGTAGLRAYDIATRAEVTGSPSTTILGLDVVVDVQRNLLWTTGAGVWRGDPTTLQGASVTTFPWYAVSIDIAGDGSVWVAERMHPTAGGSNALHHYSGTGAEIMADKKTLTSSPTCVRVHPTTGEIWYAGITGIVRYNAGGAQTVDSSGAFWSLAIDKKTGTVFAAGGNSNPVVSAFTSSGTLLTSIPGFSGSDKYVAIIP